MKQRDSRVSLKDRLQAVAEFRRRKETGESVETIAARHGVSEPLVYAWDKQAREGKLFDPEQQPAGKTPRRQHTAEFRAKAVEVYRTQPHRRVDDIAKEFGINAHLLSSWAGRMGGTRKEARQTGVALAVRPPPKHVEVTAPQQLALPPQPAIVELEAEVRSLKEKLGRARELIHKLVEAAF